MGGEGFRRIGLDLLQHLIGVGLGQRKKHLGYARQHGAGFFHRRDSVGEGGRFGIGRDWRRSPGAVAPCLVDRRAVIAVLDSGDSRALAASARGIGERIGGRGGGAGGGVGVVQAATSERRQREQNDTDARHDWSPASAPGARGQWLPLYSAFRAARSTIPSRERGKMCLGTSV